MKSSKRIDNKMSIIFLVLLISFAINIVLTSALVKAKGESKVSEKHFTEENKMLDHELNSKDNDTNKAFDTLYSQKLKKLLDSDEITSLAQKQWTYKLTANGNDVNSKTIYLTDTNVKLVLAEIKNKEDIFPDDLAAKGRITGGDPKDSLDSHLQVVSLAASTKSSEQQGGDSKIIYEFKNVPHGTIITLTLSDMLKYKLNFGDKLDDNKVELIFK